jgi:NADH-quinone oxidoreductase subunit M
MVQRVFFGKVTHAENESLKDLGKREIGLLLPVLLFIVWIGVYPSTFLKESASHTQKIVLQMQAAKTGVPIKTDMTIK